VDNLWITSKLLTL